MNKRILVMDKCEIMNSCTGWTLVMDEFWFRVNIDIGWILPLDTGTGWLLALDDYWYWMITVTGWLLVLDEYWYWMTIGTGWLLVLDGYWYWMTTGTGWLLLYVLKMNVATSLVLLPSSASSYSPVLHQPGSTIIKY